ncbi:transglycosylase SLT domain-containing protein [Nocardia sp. CNY236]|uniref:transglycosylase SLT domain-containing protein n=1 Tax=Nocardia sp. CNY236 TaxID=1169152 RepID=UPI00040A3737|nr:transglycosylase SLT domain-containing protein [Nocardia sp. CNY236]
MILTVPDVANWQPQQLSAAGISVETLSQGLDAAVDTGAAATRALAEENKWSGSAGEAAQARMHTEKVRASTVSAALLDLSTALTVHVQHVAEAKATVVRLRDDALGQTPPFEVAPDGTVTAEARIANLRAHSDKADVELLVIQEALQAASRSWELTMALKTAQEVAEHATAQLGVAVDALEVAFAALGEPTSNLPTDTPATAPASSSSVPTSSFGSPTSISSGAPAISPAPEAASRVMGGGYTDSSGSQPGASYGAGPGPSAPAGPLPSGDVGRWVEEAKQKLIAMGYDPAAIDERAIAMIIQHESAGNPYAENRWDSNWIAGHPSKGLMQTIDSTFNAYKAPGHDDIWNPVDNIIAGVRYAIDRYGSLGNVPGVAAVNSGGAYQGY